jgi:hypothetical protein
MHRLCAIMMLGYSEAKSNVAMGCV